jgi:hypothetical protein
MKEHHYKMSAETPEPGWLNADAHLREALKLVQACQATEPAIPARALARLKLRAQDSQEASPKCEKFNPLVNGGDYRGTFCCTCGEIESAHKQEHDYTKRRD